MLKDVFYNIAKELMEWNTLFGKNDDDEDFEFLSTDDDDNVIIKIPVVPEIVIKKRKVYKSDHNSINIYNEKKNKLI